MKKQIFNKKKLCLLLCVTILLEIFAVFNVSKATTVHAATTSQNNIVARADYLYDKTWVCQSNVSGWNYNYTFYAGNTYHLPYGQPINSGYYIGYGVSVDTFMNAANTYGSSFYNSRSTYGSTSSVYYATDCSAFVSWCWGVDRKTTYSIPQISTYIGMATASNAYQLQLGDCLNSNDVGHVVLVTGLTYDSNGNLTQIEITEQTPPQLKRSYYTPSSLGSKYGTYYGIYRYSGTVPAAPEGYTNTDTGSSSSGSTTGNVTTEITTKYYPACTSSYTSLIPAMASIGVNLTWELQCEIAELNGITDFSGMVEQNTTLLNLLKSGKLLNPNYVPVSYYPACASSYTSFYPAMESLGYTVDWELHCSIAAANGITDFSGTAEQNTSLLNLLKTGKLIIPGTEGSEDSGSSGSTSGSTGTVVTDGSNGYERGYAGGMAGTGNYEAFGLDISSYQAGAVNFNYIKDAGYDYVILRAGTTKGKDSYFDTFYTLAKAAGLDVGAYYYSYATNTATAKSDAQNMLSYISGKTFEYPIYFDYEDSSQQSLSSSLSESICLTFMDMLAEEGYLVGMYTGKYFSTLLPLNTICDRYEIWIAHYLGSGTGYDGTDDYYKYGPSYASQYGMYQFTDSVRFTLGGKSWGPYDGDVCFKDYPTICKTYGFNGYEPTVKEEEKVESTYLSKCEFYPAHCQIKIKTATDIYSEPRSSSNTNTSVKLEAAPLNTVYTATGLYKNGGGNLWYRVTTSTGETGYIYSGRTTYVQNIDSDIELTDYDVPNGHVRGDVFTVSGNISADYSQLDKARVYICSGFGTVGTRVTGGFDAVSDNKYTLDNSTIDEATSFGTLQCGNYTYVVAVEYTNYYAKTTKEVKDVTGSKILETEYFVVIPSKVDQSACNHKNSTVVLSEATCTQDGSSVTACLVCGLIEENTIKKSHSYGKYTVTKQATCTEAGSKSKTCTACGKVYTKKIDALGHTWQEATYVAPKTCSTCGITSGEPLVNNAYLEKCTFYPSYCKIKIKTATYIYSEPRTAKSTNTSVELEAAPLDTEYTVIGLYENTGGNLWYKVKTSTGRDGYIYSGRTTYVKKLYSDIKISDCEVPSEHVEGEIFTVSGTIESTYNELKKARVYVYSGFDKSGEKVLTSTDNITNNSYVLNDSSIDNAIYFDSLEAGNYTYVISVTYSNYYAKTTKKVGVYNSSRTLKNVNFVVVP